MRNDTDRSFSSEITLLYSISDTFDGLLHGHYTYMVRLLFVQSIQLLASVANIFYIDQRLKWKPFLSPIERCIGMSIAVLLGTSFVDGVEEG
jgi:hypothetical protein